MKKIESILILDDKQENIDAYKKAIKGYYPYANVTYAYSEKEGLKLIKKENYDVIITDRVMEDEYSGHRIIDKSIDYGIPAFMITEYHHGGTISSISPVIVNEVPGVYQYYGPKKSPETLNQLLSQIFKQETDMIETRILFKTTDLAIERYKKYTEKQIWDMDDLLDYYKEILLEATYKGKEYLDQK